MTSFSSFLFLSSRVEKYVKRKISLLSARRIRTLSFINVFSRFFFCPIPNECASRVEHCPTSCQRDTLNFFCVCLCLFNYFSAPSFSIRDIFLKFWNTWIKSTAYQAGHEALFFLFSLLRVVRARQMAMERFYFFLSSTTTFLFKEKKRKKNVRFRKGLRRIKLTYEIGETKQENKKRKWLERRAGLFAIGRAPL